MMSFPQIVDRRGRSSAASSELVQADQSGRLAELTAQAA